MSLVDLTKEIILSLCTDKDSVNVKEFETDEENIILIEVMVSEEDYGKVIGKGGHNINAIRTLVQASSYLKDNKRVRINVEKF
jgi:predicted RNA-binding protein YlqC (UPF0109 family)